jgi:Tfp pilus assembly protein PilP
MRCVKTLALGILLGAAGPGLQAQAKPATTATKPAPQPQAKPAAQNAAKPGAPAASTQAKPAAPATTKPAAKPAAAAKPGPQAAKPARAAKAAAKKPAPKKAPKPAASASTKPVPEREPKIARRDPFESLVGREQAAATAAKNLPPGKAGLQVSTLRLDGIVRAPNGMIAVVSNPQARTYFLREGDQLYDGRVEKIAMDGVSFHEVGKDAFGKPVERQVNKRIYASAGEQQ